jgi:hypothetical protein
MLKSYSFPSVYETINRELPNVADDILNGLRLKMDNDDYMVGNLALREGFSPNKNFNGAPTDTEYNLLSKAALLMMQPKKDEKLFITTGFPFATYLLYRDQVKDRLLGTHSIAFDASTFGESSDARKEIEISRVDVLPEIMGCITAIREGQLQEKDNFFIVSLGYGTCEAVVSMPSGIINRSVVSTQGIRHAVKFLSNELSKNMYLNLKTEHQIDVAFQRGSMVVNRAHQDLNEIRKKALTTYYQDVISPSLKKAFLDDDFLKCNKMYIVGGGALYPELIECFKKEFSGIVSLESYPEPDKCASHGYCLHSKQQVANVTGNGKAFRSQIAAGLDIGNATTCITAFTNEVGSSSRFEGFGNSNGHGNGFSNGHSNGSIFGNGK